MNQPAITPLTTEQMVTAAETFQGAYEHALGNFVGEAKASVVRFCASIILQEKPYMLVGAEGASHAVDLVFGNEGNRDFIFMLSYTFFARFGEGHDPVQQLSATLARGVTIPSGREMSIVPEALRVRLPQYQEVQSLLADNQWLMTLLLLQLFITASPEKA